MDDLEVSHRRHIGGAEGTSSEPILKVRGRAGTGARAGAGAEAEKSSTGPASHLRVALGGITVLPEQHLGRLGASPVSEQRSVRSFTGSLRIHWRQVCRLRV